MGGLFQLFLRRGADFQYFSHRLLLGLFTVGWNCHGPLGVAFLLLIEDQGLVLSAILSHLILIGLCCVFGLCHSFKSCALSLSILLHSFHIKFIFSPVISSSVVPFSSCPQSFPASGSFQMSQFFVSGGQSIGVSASASVLPMNTQD